MKNLIKKIALFASVLGVAVMMAACSSSPQKTGGKMDYVQTHQDDDVTKVSAKMHQVNGSKDKMGTIKFHETESGLQMLVDMKDVRPGQEYSLEVWEIKGCDMKKKNMSEQEKIDMKKKCKMEKMDLNLPTITGDANGKINKTYMITGLTAAKLNMTKIKLHRDGKAVGWGMLEKGMIW